MLQRTYNMTCSKCPTSHWYIDLEDAYDNGWSSHNCPNHVTENDEYHNYYIHCSMCHNYGTYKDLQDAYDHGWFVDDDVNLCPNHVTLAP